MRTMFFRKPLITVLIILVFAFMNVFMEIPGWGAKSGPLFPEIYMEYEQETEELTPESVGELTVPYKFGVVTEKYTAAKSSPVVLYIQDAHCVFSCQENIAGIIDYLQSVYGIKTGALEGGSGPYNFSMFEKIVDEETRHKIAVEIMRSGRVSGAELYYIDHPGNIRFSGVEDILLYFQNLDVYRKSLVFRDKADKYLSQFVSVWKEIKDRVYSDRLRDFSDMVEGYRNDAIDLKKYYQYLMETAVREGVGIEGFPLLNEFRLILENESRINFSRANVERKALIDELEKKLSPVEMKYILGRVTLFEKGEIPLGVFYKMLFRKAARKNIDAEKAYPDLYLYARYINEYDAFDKSGVMPEIKKLEKTLVDSIAGTEDEKYVWNEGEALDLWRGLFSITLTQEEYVEYIGLKRYISAASFESFCRDTGSKNGIDFNVPPEMEVLDSWTSHMEKFYGISFKRDRNFIERLKLLTQDNGNCIFVSGGFHKENMTRLMKEAGFSYAVILPKMEVKSIEESPYYELLSGQPDSLEIELDKISKFMLSLPTVFQEINVEDLRVQLGSEALSPDIIALIEEANSESDKVKRDIAYLRIGFMLEARGEPYVLYAVSRDNPDQVMNITFQKNLPEKDFRGEVIRIGGEKDTDKWSFYVLVEQMSRPAAAIMELDDVGKAEAELSEAIGSFENLKVLHHQNRIKDTDITGLLKQLENIGIISDFYGAADYSPRQMELLYKQIETLDMIISGTSIIFADYARSQGDLKTVAAVERAEKRKQMDALRRLSMSIRETKAKQEAVISGKTDLGETMTRPGGKSMLMKVSEFLKWRQRGKNAEEPEKHTDMEKNVDDYVEEGYVDLKGIPRNISQIITTVEDMKTIRAMAGKVNNVVMTLKETDNSAAGSSAQILTENVTADIAATPYQMTAEEMDIMRDVEKTQNMSNDVRNIADELSDLDFRNS
ncbi:MAG: hypothetical protein ABH883_03675, partial [Candidatus Omnitrophota bacterium]